MDKRVIDLIRTQIPEPNLAASQNPLVLFLADMKAAFDALDAAPPVTPPDPVDPPSVDSVTINEDTPTIELPGTVQLSVTVVVSGDAPPATTVTWASDDVGVATVDADGLVTGVAVGTATITATSTEDTGVSGTVVVTVTDDE